MNTVCQQRCPQPQPAEVQSRSHTAQQLMPARKNEQRHVAVESVVLPVGSHGDVPEPERRIAGRGRQIQFILVEGVVDKHKSGVGIQIPHVVPGILAIDHDFHIAAIFPAKPALHEKIPVPLALRVFPNIVYDSSGNSALGIVIICLSHP